VNKNCITTKTELIRYIESNFPESGLRVELSKKFNLYNWLAITVISSCISFVILGLFFEIIGRIIDLKQSLGFYSTSFSILLYGVVTGVIIKLLEFYYRYQIK
jgi:hypothetical protein